MNQLEVVWSIEKYIMNTTIFFFFIIMDTHENK